MSDTNAFITKLNAMYYTENHLLIQYAVHDLHYKTEKNGIIFFKD